MYTVAVFALPISMGDIGNSIAAALTGGPLPGLLLLTKTVRDQSSLWHSAFRYIIIVDGRVGLSGYFFNVRAALDPAKKRISPAAS